MVKRDWHSNIFKEWYKIQSNKIPFCFWWRQCVTVEIEKRNLKNLLITFCYRPTSSAFIGLNSFLEYVFKANTENKPCFVVGALNLNCLDYNENLEIQTSYNRIFANGCISLITKPNGVTSETVFLIDNIFVNFNWNFKLFPRNKFKIPNIL